MTLEQLRIFVAVAERLHFTQAARDLHLTQSAVSAAVAALETRIGMDLFHRIARHVELSSEGAAFLVEAKQVLAAARHAEAALDEMSGLHRGRLVVMGSQTIATYWLPPLLYKFHQRYPGISIQLSIGNTAQVAAAVISGEGELGVVEGTVDAPVLMQKPVDHDRMALVMGGTHIWAAEQALEAEHLRRLPWILREPGSGTRAAIIGLLASRGLVLQDVEVVLELPSNEAVRAAVEAGAGASVLSMLVVGTSLKARSLRAASLALPGRKFIAVHHVDRRLGGAARAFMGMMA